MIDDTDRAIINALQGGFPICAEPFRAAAEPLGLTEAELITRIEKLLANGALSRFGPLYNAERMGGAVTLAGLAAPEADFDRITALVNAHPEVSHNYARTHALNMWFVISTERKQVIDAVIGAIERETGLQVYNMPKLEEYFIGLRLSV